MKQVMKIGILLIGILLLLQNCEKEKFNNFQTIENNIEKDEISKEYVNLYDYPNIITFLNTNSVFSNVLKSNNFSSNNQTNDASNIPVLMTTTENGDTTFTLDYYNELDIQNLYFDNLVVFEPNMVRDELYSYIIRYRPNLEWLIENDFQLDLNNYIGTIQYLNIDYSINGEQEFTNNTSETDKSSQAPQVITENCYLDSYILNPDSCGCGILVIDWYCFSSIYGHGITSFPQGYDGGILGGGGGGSDVGALANSIIQSLENSLNIEFTVEQNSYLLAHPDQALQLFSFLSLNNNSLEAQQFAIAAMEALESNNYNSLDEYLNTLVIFDSPESPTAIEIDLQNDIIDCFDTTNNQNGYHTITIYVDQPVENSNDTYDINIFGDIEVGHTFIGLEQGSNGVVNQKVLGLYPNGGVSPDQPETSAIYIDDGGHDYDVSIRIEVTPTVFNAMINYISSINTSDPNYNLNNNNCSNFALSLFNLSGSNIPDTSANWEVMGNVLGGGTNPGSLGQDIRNLNPLPTGTLEHDTNGGNAINSNPCN